MFNIKTGARYVKVTTGGAYNLDWALSYDQYAGQSIVKSSLSGQITTATTTTLIGDANSDPINYFVINELYLKNTSGSTNTVKILIDLGTSREISPLISLGAGEVLIWANGSFSIFTASGILRSGTSYTRVNKQVAPLATTETTLYTVPASTYSELSTIFVANRGAAAGTFRISLSVGGGATANKDYLYYDVTLAANDTFMIDNAGFANATDVARVYASTADFSFNLSAKEYT